MKKKKPVTDIEAVLAFKKSMQKLCNNSKSGFTSISISSPTFNDGKEIVIAQKDKK